MLLSQNGAGLFVPDGLAKIAPLKRVTHLGVGAHPDDLEIMAVAGILECFQVSDQWFGGIVMTDGRGCPRAGAYADYSDDQMRSTRRREQEKAAQLGEYGVVVMLDYPDQPNKGIEDNSNRESVVEDLRRVLRATQPRVVYTHSLADQHPGHVVTTLRLIDAIRYLPEGNRPDRLFGCEVWGNLDWLSPKDRVPLNVSSRPNLQAALLGVFESQIEGGKRYDLATLGRRRAHATYDDALAVDELTGLAYAMDLTPLIADDSKSALAHVEELIQRFGEETRSRIAPSN
jgi:LmbE family N-acetylglucosaminyl deacetylase